MNIKEMIEVMQAYERGEKIEGRTLGANEWGEVEHPSWNFSHAEYRIAKQEPKKVKMLALINMNSGIITFTKEGGIFIPNRAWKRAPWLDGEVEG